MGKMDCLAQSWRRTSPMRGSISRKELVPSKPPRVNGWSWPPQVFQVVGWLVFVYLAVVSFGIYIPLLPLPWSQVLYSLTAITFVVHFFTHVAAVSLDPADASVRAKQSYSSPVPFFDRTKRSHVIQDLHCYLCDVNVGPKVKHCGVCNKCVEDFDHHCKWLNTCVGRRNYWCFFAALSSAALGTLLLVALFLFIFIQHYLDPHSLRSAPQFHSLPSNGTWLLFIPLAPVETSSAGLLILAFLTEILSIVCLLLLCHLLGFHCYLFYKGMSTYDYVKLQRQKESRTGDSEPGNPHDGRNKDAQNQISTTDCEPTLAQDPSEHWIKGSICTELEDFRKTTETENAPPCDAETKSQRTAKEIKPWTSGGDEEEPGPGIRAVDRVPGVQDPLGSSVMTPDHT